MKLCILIDNHFPYGKTESFLESEVPFLEATFDKLIVIVTGKQSDQTIRECGQNTTVITCRNGNSKLAKILALITGLLFCCKEERCEIRKLSALKHRFISYYFEGSAFIRYKSIFKSLKRTIPFENIDQCVIYSYWFALPAQIAVHISRLMRSYGIAVKLVSRAHGYDVYSERQKSGFLSHRPFLFSKVDGVYCCSENGAKYMRDNYAKYCNKIHTAYLGTNDYGLSPVEKESTYTIVSCSNIIPLKRVDLILDTVSFILNLGYDINWVCFGDGSQLDCIQSKANELQIGSHVKFMHRQPNTAVLEYYRTHHIDLFINLSIYEGLPVSIMEAMSFGIPVLATDVGGTSEIVVDGVGELVDRDSTIEEISQKAIALLLIDGEKNVMMREHIRTVWLKRFSADKNYVNWCEMLIGS